MTSTPISLARQIPLKLSLDGEAILDNFYVTAANRQLIEILWGYAELAMPSKKQPQEKCDHLKSATNNEVAIRYVYVWGKEASGRSHLLQALCHRYSQLQKPAFYLSLRERDEYAPELLHGLEEMSLVCLDDIDQVCGDKAWEEALFHCYNALLERGKTLIVAGNTAPINLNCDLADLKSRLQAGLIYELQELDDDAREQALIFRAQRRGIPLADNVASFITLRCHRSMTAMMHVLDQLDQATLAKQQRVTIPLVKEITGW